MFRPELKRMQAYEVKAGDRLFAERGGELEPIGIVQQAVTLRMTGGMYIIFEPIFERSRRPMTVNKHHEFLVMRKG